MDKQSYFISVSNYEIVPAPQGGSELEILATNEDVTRLQQMFDKLDHEDKQVTVHRSKTPYERFNFTHKEDQDERNEPFDQSLTEIYQFIYDLGTEKTRKHIEDMNLLEKVDPNV